MNASIYRISLELQETQANVNLDVKRGDTKRILHISLTDGGKPYQISDECTAVFTALKPDGKKVFNDCQISGNEILYTLTPQTVVAEGVCQCEIKLYGADSGLLTSARFELAVNETVYNEGDVIESTDEFNELARLIGEASAVPSSVLLKEDDKLDALVENGRYYLAGGTDNLLIRQMLRDAGVPVPEEMNAEGIFARAMFVDVTRVEGISAGPDDPVGQPCQQLTVYFDLEKGDGTWVYEFHRVHDFTGSHPDGSAWGGWITATKNHLEVEPEVFIAEYGVTTADEVFHAFLDGKVCFAKHDGDVLPMLNCNENIKAMLFCGLCSGVYKEFRLLPAGWMEKTEFRHKVTAVTDGATDNQIPTAKAVWDLGLKKLDANKLPEAVEDALAQAKASGAFDGPQGEQGPQGPQGPKGEQGEPGLANLFVAEYGVTTADEVCQAFLEGKGCFAKRNAVVLPMVNCNVTRRVVYFCGMDDGFYMEYQLSAGGWQEIREDYRKAEEIAEDTSDDQIPTVGAVRELVAENAGESDLMVVAISRGSNPGSAYSADKTYEEIDAEWRNGKAVIAVYNGRLFTALTDDPSGVRFYEFFKNQKTPDGSIESGSFLCSSGDVWTYSEVDTPSEESGPMVVNVTGGGPRPYSADKTYAEIFAELRAGRLVFANNNRKLLIATGYDPGGIRFGEFLTAGADWAIELFCGYGDVWTYTNVELSGGGAGSVKTVNGIAPDETGNVQLTAQPDWNQNDETAPDYIKNKPFYEGVQSTAIAEWEVPLADGYALPDAEYIFDDVYTIEINGEKFPMMLSWQFDSDNNWGYVGFNLKHGENVHSTPVPEDGAMFYLWANDWAGVMPSTGDRLPLSLNVTLLADFALPATVKVLKEEQVISVIDPKYLPDEIVNRKPLVLDANFSDYYGGHPGAGDEALEAIKTGRQILVRVPNASGDNYVASYSPVYMYQLPCDGQYLYLFYLRDEKQDLSALLGQPAGTVLMPTYGQFMMLLSQRYDHDPLEG